MIEEKIKSLIRDVHDFPKKGIVFKDITPLLKDPVLCMEITQAFCEQLKGIPVDVVASIESRGFLFGMMMAQALGCAFVPLRKQGKLPYKTIQQTYALEYGTAVMEIHEDAIQPGQQVLIHDDLLATGGTVEAASRLITGMKGEIAAYSFVISLDFLKGKARLMPYSDKIITLAAY